jgi:hypothetical protein
MLNFPWMQRVGHSLELCPDSLQNAQLSVEQLAVFMDLLWLTNINRPTQTKGIPSFLTKYEVAGVLAVMEGLDRFVGAAALWHGMRLTEGCAYASRTCTLNALMAQLRCVADFILQLARPHRF